MNAKLPFYFMRWVNVKKLFQTFFQRDSGLPLSEMLKHVGLNFEGDLVVVTQLTSTAGRPHSGIADARNITRLAQELAKKVLAEL